MGSLSVVPEEPLNEAAVELWQVVRQKISVLRDECFRECAVEPLDLTLHLGTARVTVEMHNPFLIEKHVKVIRELTAVVRLHMRHGYR